MSVIVCVRDETRCVMACDSQAGDSEGKRITRSAESSKIVRTADGILIGASGQSSLREFASQWISQCGPSSPIEVIAQRYAHDRREWLKARDLHEDHEGSKQAPGYALIARGNEFAFVDGIGSVILLASPWWAIGSGAAEARGALYSLHKTETAYRYLPGFASAAVEAACALDDSCGLPVHVFTMDGE